MQKAFYVQPENSNARYATSLVTSQQCVTKKVKVNTHQVHFNFKPKAQQLHVGALYTLHDADSSEYESEIEDTFCLQMKIHGTHISHPKVPKPVYLMANLVYRLQEHHQRNQYLWARLDTCADVNLMPMAVYCLMFRDQ